MSRVTHGFRPKGKPSPTYKVWEGMRERCLNRNHKSWARYGGRGITVCERWAWYPNFLADMGERPAGKSLDRFPNGDGNYERDNCRWATPKEQQRNMRSNALLTVHGVTRTVAEWSERTGINYTTIRQRVLLGWDADEVLSPVRKRKGNTSRLVRP